MNVTESENKVNCMCTRTSNSE